MSDLPSRDADRQPWWEAVADDLDAGGRSEAGDVIRLWWSGRLVDRDTIDRDAAFEIGVKWWTKVHNGQRPSQKMRAYLWNFLGATFDVAALGDTDAG